MSVYARETPEYLDAALHSLSQQINQPDEILIVKDGPIGPALSAVLEKYSQTLRLRTIQIPENRGLAQALNIGIAEARHPWIMRFDTDYICTPDRVAHQRATIEAGTLDIFGSQIVEFDDKPNLAIKFRKVPTKDIQIALFARKRNPFNHMTVCYRKDLVLRCGGYPDIPFMEDYGLWIKMLAAGAKSANDSKVLVKARVGNGMMQRRGGLKYARSEFLIQALMVRTGFKSVRLAVLHAVARASIRLVPAWLRSFIYNRSLRHSI